MRVFLTGATGFIGSAILRELLGAGYEVLGLARNEDSAATVRAAGAHAHLGELTDLDSLTAGAKAADGVIHTAFGHDFSKYLEAGENDRRAVETIANALEGTGKPFVITSGTMILPPGKVGQETDLAAHDSPAGVRAPSEEIIVAAAQRRVRGTIMRLPPSVHGEGDRGFVPALIDVARRTGVSAYVGEGDNRWPTVHRLDAVRLFRLALEKGEPGQRVHAVAEEGVPMRSIAEAIGELLGVPVRGIDEAEAVAHFDWLARFAQIDNPTSGAATRASLGWEASEVDLLTDIRSGAYRA
ncbi:SDR family oxidoreductase [Sphingomonas sp. BK580]|uniref:SDR family oxidoreductase n=1 Tax=Sphingomonas sp. BK580 TaxID=2586972 RepID=UPI001615E3F1|nr:SDR family oxidoreductase [Sphingomonas sp. BK580]MBB3695625.1 nucleoside-diphosphate-sugar epimerase [Sphingomonas sp. BK580]